MFCATSEQNVTFFRTKLNCEYSKDVQCKHDTSTRKVLLE